MASRTSSWFEKLFGFREELEQESPGAFERVQAAFEYNPAAGTLRSKANGATFVCGSFLTPSLGELRAEAAGALRRSGARGVVTVVHDAVLDILEEHARHPHALFQAASQMNTLEMPSRGVAPEAGITAYEWDRTQGPACAIACAAGTVVRNYFADVGALASSHRGLPPKGGPLGQRAGRQVNNLDAIEQAVRNDELRLWSVRNGYVCAARDRLAELAGAVEGSAQRDALLPLLKIGLQEGTGVCFARGAHVYEPPAAPVAVSQAYCSAMPVEDADAAAVAPLARLLLDGAYEATLWAAVRNAARTGCADVFLTFVGGGVWGNDPDWIVAAIARAVGRVAAAGAGLRVHVCHFRAVDARLAGRIDRAVAEALPGTGSGGAASYDGSSPKAKRA